EKEFIRLEDSKYRVSGKAPIDEFNEKMGSNIPNDDFDTVGGFIFHSLGRSPKRGDSITYENIQFTVEKIASHRIISVRTQTNGLENKMKKKNMDGHSADS
ncbi:MAG: transporter associated domain-containing protein, partial [Nitrospinota bacterium]